MVRQSSSPRWNGEKRPTSRGKARSFVDFGDQDDSEAAVERWLTSPAATSRMSSSPKKTKTASWNGKHAMESTGGGRDTRTTVSSPGGGTRGKQILQERLRQKSSKRDRLHQTKDNNMPKYNVTTGSTVDRVDFLFHQNRNKTSGTTTTPTTSASTRTFSFSHGDLGSRSSLTTRGASGEKQYSPSQRDTSDTDMQQLVAVVSNSSMNEARHGRRSIESLTIDAASSNTSPPKSVRERRPRSQPRIRVTTTAQPSVQASPLPPPKPPQSSPTPQTTSVRRNPSSDANLAAVAGDSPTTREKKGFFRSGSSRRDSTCSSKASSPGSTQSASPSHRFVTKSSTDTKELVVPRIMNQEKPRFFRSSSRISTSSSSSSPGSTQSISPSHRLVTQSSTDVQEVEAPINMNQEKTGIFRCGKSRRDSSNRSSCSSKSSSPGSTQSISPSHRLVTQSSTDTKESVLPRITVVPVQPIEPERPKTPQQSDEEREKPDSRTQQRIAQQVRQDQRQAFVAPLRTNRIRLHIYDLIANETVMQLPWGCHFPIGQCFNAVNTGLHTMGTGAYHVGIEINGVEYAFGANDIEGETGVFTCMPKNSPGYQYRTSIDFGSRTIMKKINFSKRGDNIETARSVDGREVLREMAQEYMGIDYDLLRKNCCTFAHEACLRLGVKDEEIPSWFRNLCVAGALTQDVAVSTIEPLTRVFSACDMEGTLSEYVKDTGFEVITDGRSRDEAIVDTEDTDLDEGTDHTRLFLNPPAYGGQLFNAS